MPPIKIAMQSAPLRVPVPCLEINTVEHHDAGASNTETCTPCPPRSSSLPFLSLLPRLDLSPAGLFFYYLASPRGLMTNMSGTLYGYSQSNDSDTISLVLEDGTLFTVVDTYSKAESKAVIVCGCSFPIRTSILIPAGIYRCILYLLGCHCRTVGRDRCAFQLDTVSSRT